MQVAAADVSYTLSFLMGEQVGHVDRHHAPRLSQLLRQLPTGSSVCRISAELGDVCDCPGLAHPDIYIRVSLWGPELDARDRPRQG